MGETVDYFGKPQKRHTPLDFLAVTDHAEYLGSVRESVNPDGPLAKTEWFTAMSGKDPQASGQAFQKLVGSTITNEPIPEFNDTALRQSAWRTYSAIADKYNQPGTFTTFIAFEWTSMPGGQNLHRCVVFKDKGPDIPFSAFESQDAEQLWNYLDAQRKKGLDVVAVPHNPNISNGLMFDTKDQSGRPLTTDYAKRRMANEPLVEIIQGKGQSDTSPALSPTDEFADYEMFTSLLSGAGTAKSATGSYLRQAYGVGQELREKLGVNPFKYGIEGGTDFVWSGGRKLDAQGKLPALGNTVDVKTATYTNSIGAPELVGQWTDEEFDPTASITYYARVLEIPTPRWSTYWAAKLGVPPNPLKPVAIQQRAWTSPNWYEAAGSR